MQTSDAFGGFETVPQSGLDPMVFAAAGAAVLGGLAIAGLVYAIAGSVRVDTDAAAAHLGSARREMSAGRQRWTDSPTFNLGLLVMPFFRPLGAIPLDSFKKDWAKRAEAAAWPGGLSEDELLAAGLGAGVAVGGILAIVGAVLIGPVFAAVGLLALALITFLFGSSLEGIGKRRMKKIGRSMPYVIDLLVLTMRAGASFPQAMERVTKDFANHPIGEEFAYMISEINAGATRRQAFQNLGERNPIPIVRIFIDEVLQSEELGRGISDTLERLADRVRTRRKQDAIDTAGKAKVNVLAPSVLALVGVLLLMFSSFIVKFAEEGMGF